MSAALRVLVALGLAAGFVSSVQPSSGVQPDAFWSTFTPQHVVAVEHFDSLDQLVASADVVVLGRIASMRSGREFGDEADKVHYAAAELEVQRLVRGSLPDGPLTLELQLPHGEGAGDVAKYAASVPTSPVLFILRNKGREAESRGMSEQRIAGELPYFRLVIPGGLVAEANGRAVVGGSDEPYLVTLAGTDFANLIRRVEASSER